MERADIQPDETVLEVGPGQGVLTMELAKKASKVIAVEKDIELIPHLREQFSNTPHVEVVHGDILKVDLPDVSYRVIANIPYYLTSPLLTRFLQDDNRPRSLLLMVQDEVADKIVTKDANILSLLVRIYGSARKLFNVSRNAFFPAPNVDSAIIFVEVDEPVCERHRELLAFIKKGFTNRRKQIQNSLKAGLHCSSEELLRILDAAHIDPKRRPEELSVEEWVALHEVSLDIGV